MTNELIGLLPYLTAQERGEMDALLSVLSEHGEWRGWVAKHFPQAAKAPFAPRHVRLWEWFEDLEPKVKPSARVEIWPRGGAKSSTAELGVTRVGVKRTRNFAVYLCATQDQANKHVQVIASRFEALGIRRAVNGYGNSIGWRMDILRADNGFSVLALGVDAAARGVKLGDDRPDLFVIDDVDDRHDTEKTVKKKIETITESILPAGASDAAVLFIQNRIHDQSIATQLASGTADFLLDRETFEEPAINDLWIEQEAQPDGSMRWRIRSGVPTWEGQNLATCEAQLNEWGRGAFMREAQHETETEVGLWQRARDITPFREAPRSPVETEGFYRIAVAVDPNASEGNDEAGIMVGGTERRGGVIHGVLLEDATVAGGPSKWAKASVAAYQKWQADVLVAESNNGGEMVAITIGTVPGAPRVRLIHASRGKLTRAEPVQVLYENGRVHHAGHFPALEREQCTWSPGDPSPDRLDAVVWLFTELMLKPTAPSNRSLPTSGVVRA
jgi:hypothetical protein